MTKEQIFSDYLQRVADVLKLHSQALQELSKMSHLTQELEHHPYTARVMEALQGRGNRWQNTPKPFKTWQTIHTF